MKQPQPTTALPLVQMQITWDQGTGNVQIKMSPPATLDSRMAVYFLLNSALEYFYGRFLGLRSSNLVLPG